MIIDCTIPVGSTATVILPTADAAKVLEHVKALTRIKTICVNGVVDGKLNLTMQSGNYQFSCPMP